MKRLHLILMGLWLLQGTSGASDCPERLGEAAKTLDFDADASIIRQQAPIDGHSLIYRDTELAQLARNAAGTDGYVRQREIALLSDAELALFLETHHTTLKGRAATYDPNPFRFRTDSFIERYRAHPSALVRELAEQALQSRRCCPTAGTPIEESTLAQRIAQLKEQEAPPSALRKQFFGRSPGFYVTQLNSPNPYIRKAVIENLPNDPAFLPLLIQATSPQRERVSDVRRVAYERLRNWLTPEGQQAFHRAAHDPDPEIATHYELHWKDPFAWTRLAPSDDPRPPPSTGWSEVEKDKLAAQAALHIYGEGEAGKRMSPKRLAEKNQYFYDNRPRGFRVKEVLTDPMDGLKVEYLVPEKTNPSEKNAPHVMAIAGSQNLVDVLQDIRLGIEQGSNAQLQGFIERLASRLNDGKDVIITGHSLGGLVANQIAWRIYKKAGMKRPGQKLEARDVDFGTLRIVTWGAPGAEHFFKEKEQGQSRLAPEDIANLNEGLPEAPFQIVNYHHPYDLIPRATRPIGLNRRLPKAAPKILESHSMRHTHRSVMELGGTEPGNYIPHTPRKIPLLAGLGKFALSRLAKILQLRNYKKGSPKYAQQITRAQLLWLRRGGYQQLNGFQWLRAEIKQMRKRAEQDSAKEILQILDQFEREKIQLLNQLRAVPTEQAYSLTSE